MSAKVIGIMGSPRVGGNTDRMVDWVLEGARDAGAQVQKVMLKDKKIAHCRACDTCTKPPNRCVNQDDMESIQALLDEAQAVVLGTPVYWWGPSGHMKVFVDRWYGFRGDRRSTIRGKDFGLVVPLGDSDVSTARHVVGMFQDALDYLGSRLHPPVLAPDCDGPRDVEGMPAVKAQCLELGKRLASRA